MYSKAMFAKQFKELIDKRGLTQRAVAERINTLYRNAASLPDARQNSSSDGP